MSLEEEVWGRCWLGGVSLCSFVLVRFLVCCLCSVACCWGFVVVVSVMFDCLFLVVWSLFVCWFVWLLGCLMVGSPKLFVCYSVLIFCFLFVCFAFLDCHLPLLSPIGYSLLYSLPC